MLVTIAYLAIAMTVTAFDQLAVTLAIDLDRFVLIGAQVFGTALLATGVWSVLNAAWADEEVIEPGPFAPIGQDWAEPYGTELYGAGPYGGPR